MFSLKNIQIMLAKGILNLGWYSFHQSMFLHYKTFCGPFLIKGSETGLPHTSLPPADPVGEFWGLKQTCAEAHGYCWTQLPSWSVSVSVWVQGPDHLACSGPARTGTSKLDLGSLFCKETGWWWQSRSAQWLNVLFLFLFFFFFWLLLLTLLLLTVFFSHTIPNTK